MPKNKLSKTACPENVHSVVHLIIMSQINYRNNVLLLLLLYFGTSLTNQNPIHNEIKKAHYTQIHFALIPCRTFSLHFAI